MSLKFVRDIFEWPIVVFLIVGIVTAIFDVTIRGFSPAIWFLVSFWFLFVVICIEVSMIRERLEKEQG